MNDFSLSQRRERRLLTLLGVVCVALLAGALYLQFIKGEDPCPLCIIQRYFFALIAIFSFFGTCLRSWRSLAMIELLIVISALAGAGTALYHLQIQLYPGLSCGFDTLQPIVDSLPPAHWLPSVFKVAGLCETAYPPILGILLPGWVVIGFVVIFLAVASSLVRNRRCIARGG